MVGSVCTDDELLCPSPQAVCSSETRIRSTPPFGWRSSCTTPAPTLQKPRSTWCLTWTTSKPPTASPSPTPVSPPSLPYRRHRVCLLVKWIQEMLLRGKRCHIQKIGSWTKFGPVMFSLSCSGRYANIMRLRRSQVKVDGPIGWFGFVKAAGTY